MEIKKVNSLQGTSGSHILATIDSILFHLDSAITNDLISSTYEITDEAYEKIDKFYARLDLYEERFYQELNKGDAGKDQLSFILEELKNRINEIDSCLEMLKDRNCDVTIKKNVLEHLILLRLDIIKYYDRLKSDYSYMLD